MQAEEIGQQNERAERFNIVEKTLFQLQEIINDLPEDALAEPDRLINAGGCLRTALRTIQLLRESADIGHIVD
jgi:hypothetical protein